MYIDMSGELTFSFESYKIHTSKVLHTLTIWEEGGYIEVNMTNKELEALKNAIRSDTQ